MTPTTVSSSVSTTIAASVLILSARIGTTATLWGCPKTAANECQSCLHDIRYGPQSKPKAMGKTKAIGSGASDSSVLATSSASAQKPTAAVVASRPPRQTPRRAGPKAGAKRPRAIPPPPKTILAGPDAAAGPVEPKRARVAPLPVVQPLVVAV